MSAGDSTLRVVKLLAELGHDCAVVGGRAVMLRGRDRFTDDLDLAVAVESDKQTESIALALQRTGFELRTLVEQEETGRIATLRFIDRRGGGSNRIDLLFASSGIEPEIVARAESMEIETGAAVKVARRSDLIAMKTLSLDATRDQDLGDLRVLLRLASDAEIKDARAALELIEARGATRSKELGAEFDRIRRELGQA